MKDNRNKYIILLIIVVIFFMPILLTRKIGFIDFTSTGQIGDTIGGITAPFISMIAAFLTYCAFMKQLEANDIHFKRSNNQDNALSRERFEHNFFNFLSLLKSLESEVEIENVGKSKQAFHYIFYEYKAICVFILRIIKENNSELSEIFKEISFNLFINGVSKTSTFRIDAFKCMYNNEEEKELIKRIQRNGNDRLLQIQELRKNNVFIIPYLDDYDKTIKMFDGHRCRIISFYRLFYKIIEYIYIENKNNQLNIKLYWDILLSQLSEHEISLMKIIYKYDKSENKYFIDESIEEKVRDFFISEDKDIISEIDKYIHADNMNCESEKFIDESCFNFKTIDDFIIYVKRQFGIINS